MARYDAFSPDFDHPFLNSSPDYTPCNGSLRSRPIGEVTTTMSYRERSKRLKNFEIERTQLIEDLIYQLEATEKLLDQSRLDHSREIHFNRENQLRENLLQDQLNNAKAMVDRDPFVVLLIDGDGTIFNDHLLNKGEKGGREASNDLFIAANDFVAQTLPYLNNARVIARIYANVRGLGDNLCKAGVIPKASLVEDFMRGFNSGKLLFDMVDIGDRKDRTGDKLSELFDMYLYDCHCHQIVLGCSHEPEYAKLIADAGNDPYLVDRVTLLEAMPFKEELATVKSSFRTTKFENLFRTSRVSPISNPTLKFPPPTVQATLPNLTRIESNGTSASGSGTPALTWASMTAAPFVPSASRTSTPPTKAPDPPLTAHKSIPGIDRNRLGQRVDKFDPSIPRDDIQRIKKMKLCNIFYLQGADACTSEKCNHDHSYKLRPNEKKVLSEVARMTPCYWQTACEDPGCIYGHRCPQSKPGEKDCWYKEDCRFAGWGHGIDTRIVRTTKV